MINGMNAAGYTFGEPTVSDPQAAFNCYGCGMEQVQAMLRAISDKLGELVHDDRIPASLDRQVSDLWMLAEATRAREEQLDALFHAAESAVLKRLRTAGA